MMSSRFCGSTHTGTHIDAPLHFASGGRSVDELTLEECTGHADVFDLRQHSGEHITQAMLERADPGIQPGSRVVLLTGDVDRAYSHDWSYPDDIHVESAALTVEAAEWLVRKDVRQIANDFLTESMSVSNLPHDPDRPVHRTLLEADISIIEYICNTGNLTDYKRIRLDCYPLRLDGTEAAPVRVVSPEM
jgi:arylformamidase